MCIQSRCECVPLQLVYNCLAEAQSPTTRSHVYCECIKVHWNRDAIGLVQGQKKNPKRLRGEALGVRAHIVKAWAMV